MNTEPSQDRKSRNPAKKRRRRRSHNKKRPAKPPEAKAAEGLVDGIVDVTETGSTLRENGLRIVETLTTSNPQLI